jgi:hypothetical protein
MPVVLRLPVSRPAPVVSIEERLERLMAQQDADDNAAERAIRASREARDGIERLRRGD